MNRLARTQRDIIQSDTETAPCCCRGVPFGLFSLLAGLIVLTVLFKGPTPDASRGVITDNEVKGKCHSLVYFSSLRIDCDLKDRPYFLNNGTVEATYRNGSQLPAGAVNCMNGSDSSYVVCNITYAVKCSSREYLFVKFIDSNKDVVFEHTINAADPVGEMNTHITQTFTNNATTSEFDLECWYNDTCYSYYIGFYNEIGTEIKACNNPDIGPFNCSSMDRDKNCSQECSVAEECLPSRFQKALQSHLIHQKI